MADKASKYVMLISDDVMVSKYTITEMARFAADHPVILGCASNCDSTTRYLANFSLPEMPHKQLTLKMTMEELEPDQGGIINYPRLVPIILPQPWISFYCTLFPKTVLQKVGDFDESLDVRHNDVDYCTRARAIGIPSMIHLGVFALHFGDRTLPQCTSPEQYAAADEAFRKKYQTHIGQ